MKSISKKIQDILHDDFIVCSDIYNGEQTITIYIKDPELIIIPQRISVKDIQLNVSWIKKNIFNHLLKEGWEKNF